MGRNKAKVNEPAFSFHRRGYDVVNYVVAECKNLVRVRKKAAKVRKQLCAEELVDLNSR